jgi:hypothetical protein
MFLTSFLLGFPLISLQALLFGVLAIVAAYQMLR